MPDRDVTTIKDLIYYQYAKHIARSAFAVPDGATAKGNFYNFIKQTFRELQNKLCNAGNNAQTSSNHISSNQF